jgi:hypothetical protein
MTNRLTPEGRARLSEIHSGKKVSSETRAKQSAAKIGKPRPDMIGKHDGLVCPHCGKEGNGAVLYRWHFDNCPHKLE